MRKVFHFDSPAEPYRAEAAVLWCFDDRFSTVCRKFLRRIGVQRADVISIAGGAKALASPHDNAERDVVLDQIALSIRLHGCKRLILTLHSDCGAYGGIASFGNKAEIESAHHWDELAHAAELARQKFPRIAVETYFVDFNGVWSRQETAPAG